MKLHIEVDWDTDEKQADLPHELVIDLSEDVTEELSSEIVNRITDIFEHCINSFFCTDLTHALSTTETTKNPEP